jgi:hypothetical protein
MGIFDKWALKRVEKIKQKEIEAQQKIEKNNANHKVHRDVIDMVIRNYIQELIEVHEKEPVHIKVGDRAIMNYYSIKYPARNGWDGGVSSLLNNIPQEERTAPVTVIITRIYVDTSYADELIDRFFQNHANEWLYHNVKIERALDFYLSWLKRTRLNHCGSDSIKLAGLYKTATFNYEGSFQPKWGLNVFSFHPEGTPEYTKTYELWAKEIEINLKRAELNAKLKQLNDEMKQIDEEYKGIKVTELY